MDDLFEALCFLLEDELERQENILAICRAQGQAARAHDVEVLEARTAALLPLIQEAIQGETLRQRLLVQIAARVGDGHSCRTLTNLIRVASEPWASRLRYLQQRFAETFAETRSVVRANATVLRGSLRVVGQALKALDQCVSSEGAAYTADGAEPARAGAEPSMLDQKG